MRWLMIDLKYAGLAALALGALGLLLGFGAPLTVRPRRPHPPIPRCPQRRLK